MFSRLMHLGLLKIKGKFVRESVNISILKLSMLGYTQRFATIDSEVIVRDYVFSVNMADGGGGSELS